MENDINFKLVRKIAIGVVSVIALTIGGCNSIYSVDQGERGIHTRTGALVDVVNPGFHLKFPFIDGVQPISLRSAPINWAQTPEGDSRLSTYSKDQQPANIALTVTWSLPDDAATVADIFTRYGSREGLYRAVVLPKTVEAVKNVFGAYDAVSVIQQRAKFNADVANTLNQLLNGYPVIVGGVQIQDIEFSAAYEEAVEARMTAQVEVQKREQQKQTEQINADIAVIKAEASAKQTKLQGEAEASIIKVRGEAEAAAIRARADALASNGKLVELTAAEKWNGVLPSTMVPGSAVPFVTVR